MNALISKTIGTRYGEKDISVYAQDIVDIREPIDVMTVSAFLHGYNPSPDTLMGALYGRGIDVRELAASPQIDLRESSNIWLSREITGAQLPIGRIGCIEMTRFQGRNCKGKGDEGQIIASIQAYFHMLHIASLSGIPVETVGLPILGGGHQMVDVAMTAVPTINECLRFLRANEYVKHIRIISRNQSQAYQFAKSLERSYSTQQAGQSLVSRQNSDRSRSVFISYSSGDRNIADNLCAKLEAAGLKVWYAPRNIHSTDYASAIVNAITQCTDFVVIISKNSLQSHHVLNEIDLAFQELNRNIRFCPLKIDEEEMGPAFRYYLSRQHWMDAHIPPLEKRLEEFTASIAGACDGR